MKMNATMSQEKLRGAVDALVALMYEVRFNRACRDERYALLEDSYYHVYGVRLPDEAKGVLTSAWDPCEKYDPLTRFKFMAWRLNFDAIGFWMSP